MVVLRVSTVICFILAPVFAPCPNNWIDFNDSCYLFGTQLEEYVVAEQYCRQHDSHLVHVNDAAENNFIKSWLNRLPPHAWWMGLTDDLIENNWEWQDTKTAPSFTDWYPGQPDDYQNIEDCAHFLHNFNYQWDDHDCTTKNFPICERARDSSGGEIIG